MKGKAGAGKGKEGARAAGGPDPVELCRRMMTGGMPACCGAEMMAMMARWMAVSAQEREVVT